MFTIDHLYAKTPSGRIRDINFRLERPGAHALLCPNATFLDELIQIFLDRRRVTGGHIELDGKDFYDAVADGSVQMIHNFDALYDSLSVVDNILLMDRKFFCFDSRHRRERYERIMEETGFYIRGGVKAKNLSREQKKIVEIIKCYHACPKLLIVREIANFLSYKNYAIYLGVLDRLRGRGVKILYLAGQWEEAVKVADEITVISHGITYGTYPADEVRRNPSKFFPIMLGSHAYSAESPQQDEKLKILRSINENMQELTECYDLRKSLHIFSKYLLKEMRASNCVLYLLDHKQESLLQVVARDDAQSARLFLPQEYLSHILERGEFTYANQNEIQFEQIFGKDAAHRTALFYPCDIGSTAQLLVEVTYNEYYVYSEKDVLYLKWIAKEIGIIVENTKLMGNSVLLQESHHRIKNNLQIIVGLIEMEKSELESKLPDPESAAQVAEILDSISGRVQSIARVHNILCREPVASNAINMYTIVKEMARFYEALARVELDFDEVFVPYGSAVSFALVANELINNSVKHNPDRAEDLVIRISLASDPAERCFRISYQDNGGGFPEGDGRDGGGVGTALIESIVQFELGGTYRKYNDDGAHVEIEIPTDFMWGDL